MTHIACPPPTVGRLLLVEDDAQLAAIIQEGLAESQLHVERAASAREAAERLGTDTYDLLVVDINLPEGRDAGLALIRTLRDQGNGTPVLFLTARADVDSRVLGLEAGGDDYLTKPFAFGELRARVAALRRRAARPRPEAPRLPLPGGWTLDLGHREATRADRQVALTPQEFSLLACLAAYPEAVYSRAQIMERVWPEGRGVDPKLVDGLVSGVRAHLGAGVIVTVRGVGYQLGDPRA